MNKVSLLYKVWADNKAYNNLEYTLAQLQGDYYAACEKVNMCNCSAVHPDIVSIGRNKLRILFDKYENKQIIFKYSRVAYVAEYYITKKIYEAIQELEKYANRYPEYPIGLENYMNLYDEVDLCDTSFNISLLLEKFVNQEILNERGLKYANSYIDEINDELKVLGYHVSIPYIKEDKLFGKKIIKIKKSKKKRRK